VDEKGYDDMLSYMRKNAGSWLIKVLLFGVALSFVIGFGILPALRDDKGGGVVVAQVGERRITRGEWNQAYENLIQVYRRVYQDRFSEEMVKQMRLRETALDNLINMALQIHEASRLGLEVSDEELRDRIQSLPYFQRNGSFAKDQYLRLLQMNRLTPADFERQQRDEMLVEAFQNFVRGTVKVSEQELWNSYVLENEQVRLEALVVNPASFEEAVEVEEESLKEYFGRNSEGFLTPEKVNAAYVLVAPGPYRDQVKVYTGDIEEYYDSHIEEFSKPEEVHVRHILLRVLPGADESVRMEKRKTMEGLLERVRAGEDFGELAKIYSEDIGSKKGGGDLGYVKRGTLVPEVERAAFAMKPGEVSDIVSSSYGLHLIKVEDYRASHAEPLEDVKEKIRETLTEEKAWRLARRKAEETSWDLKEKGGLPEAGSSQGDFVVKETGYFSRADAIPDLGREPSFVQTAFSLEPGQMSEVIRGDKGYYLLQVIDKKAPEIPPFEEVRDRVEEQFRREESRTLAKEKAKEVLEAAASGTSVDRLTEQEGVEAMDTGFITRLRGFIPRIGASEEILETAFNLTERSPWAKQVFEVDGKFYVIRFQERRDPDRAAFLAEKEELLTQQQARKAQEIYREWLTELRKQQEVKISSGVGA
jgi:peptidyl-prolyl cis-trans isomerase D